VFEKNHSIGTITWGQPFNALLPKFRKKVSNICSMFYSQGHFMFLFPHQEEND
jgi:hypothetical protein